MKVIHPCKIVASIIMVFCLVVTQYAFLRKALAEEPVRVESPATDMMRAFFKHHPEK